MGPGRGLYGTPFGQRTHLQTSLRVWFVLPQIPHTQSSRTKNVKIVLGNVCDLSCGGSTAWGAVRTVEHSLFFCFPFSDKQAVCRFRLLPFSLFWLPFILSISVGLTSSSRIRIFRDGPILRRQNWKSRTKRMTLKLKCPLFRPVFNFPLNFRP